MAAESESNLRLEIGHVLFIDLVGYSKLLIEEQKERLRQLSDIVLATPQVREATNEQLLRLPTGDGMALVFRTSSEEPAQCALEIAKALKDHREIQVRMGIHSGPVSEMTDVNGRTNIAGAGINMAQRVMACGDAGHILLSKRAADDLTQYRRWQGHLHELGDCEVKHGVRISVVNLYTDDIGNPELPAKLKNFVGATNASRAKSKRLFRRVVVAVASLVIGALIIATIFLFRRPAPKERRAESNESLPATTEGSYNAAAVIPKKSIAVLPFVNLSADKNDEYLSDGMTEELLNALTKVRGLRVPGRSSSFAFKGKNEEDIFRKVGQELHVSTVLEGSVRKAGDKLRVTAQLINIADGYHLWSEDYDGDMKDILAFQSDVAKRVVEALQLQLGVEEARALSKRPTENPEAYRLYLRGRYDFAKFTQDGWSNAIRDFEQALQLDPGFALAYCGLADVYGFGGGLVMSGKEAWAKQMQLARKAVALDPDLAEAHVSMAGALQTSLDFKASVKELDQAVRLNPSLASAYDEYGWTFACLGQFEKAVANEKKALELDPLNSLYNADLAYLFYWSRRYDDAIAQVHSTLELDPNNAFAHLTLGWCFIWKGKIVEARREFEKAATLDDLPWYKSSLGYAAAVSSDRAKAEQISRDLEEMSRQRYVSTAHQATIYLGLGEKEKALDSLDKAFEDRDPVLWWIKDDQLYDSVRNEPRFQALLQKVEKLEEGSKE